MSATGALAAAQTSAAGEEVEAVVEVENPAAAAKEVEEEVGAENTGEESAQSAGVSQKEREEAALRVREAAGLPPAVRERLAALVAASEAPQSVPLEECLRLLEESLPEFLRDGRGETARPQHPVGEMFFSGNQEDASDAEAEEVARQQLLRSGLLRGQRVRVAE